jgi:iron complex transport system substrate-binding protein
VRNLFFLLAFVYCQAVFAEGQKLRVVSLSPVLTETVFQLGMGGCLVGRSSADTWPPEVKNIPAAGGVTPNLEAIAALSPDLVIASSESAREPVESALKPGARFMLLKIKDIDRHIENVRLLGAALGCPETAAAEIRRYKARLDKLREENTKTPRGSRPKVYLEIWGNTGLTPGKKSFINECIELAGGVNVAGDVDADCFIFSEERVIRSMPDVMICPSLKGPDAEGSVLSRPAWGDVPAVRNKRVYCNLNEDILYRPGPRLLEGIETLRTLIGKK